MSFVNVFLYEKLYEQYIAPGCNLVALEKSVKRPWSREVFCPVCSMFTWLQSHLHCREQRERAVDCFSSLRSNLSSRPCVIFSSPLAVRNKEHTEHLNSPPKPLF